MFKQKTFITSVVCFIIFSFFLVACGSKLMILSKPDPCNITNPEEAVTLSIKNFETLGKGNYMIKWLVNNEEVQYKEASFYEYKTQKTTGGEDRIEVIIFDEGVEKTRISLVCKIIIPTPTNTLPSNTPTPTPTPPIVTGKDKPSLMKCDPKSHYLATPQDWETDYSANDTIALEDIYKDKYGKVRDYFDLYAIAYYNNRKALEGDSYHIIDPNKLSVDYGWSVFLPPPAWIDKYRDFPTPILETPNSDLTDLTIDISGTSALSPLSFQIAECFNKATEFTHIKIEPDGTKIGAFDYCQSDIIMFNGSVELNEETLRNYGCGGIKFHKFEVARYAITIIINEENPNANKIRDTPLTPEQLKELLISATSWNEVRDDLTNAPINRYYPPKESGTYKLVRNLLFPNQEFKSEIPNPFKDEDEYLISGMVADDINSIGIAAYGSYQLNKTRLRTIPISGVSPNPDTLKGDTPTYPLVHPLYLYTGETSYISNPLLRYFIQYYLAYEFDFINELGYLYPNREAFLNNPNTIP